MPQESFLYRWSSLGVHGKRKGYYYLAFEIQILLYFLNQRLYSTLANCVPDLCVTFCNLNHLILWFQWLYRLSVEEVPEDDYMLPLSEAEVHSSHAK